MRTLLRILPVIFLMTMLFACKKDNAAPPASKDAFTPPYVKTFLPPYSNQDVADTVRTENRDF